MEEMDLMARDQYLKVLIRGYLKGDRKTKGRTLDEYCKNTGQSRKYVIRKIGQILIRGRVSTGKKRKRNKTYEKDVEMALVKVWKTFDYPCGQRLKPILEFEIDRLIDFGELDVTRYVRVQLKGVSSATIDRLLKPHKIELYYQRKSNKGKGSLLYKKIPLKMTEWDIEKVGFVEMDLVCHCGASTAGEYINTLSVMEISSGWWEGEAIMGRGQYPTFEALTGIRQRNPFRWLGIDSDNDSVFINNHLKRYCDAEGLEFTRSRPYRKNDNAYIEQKNYTHVRRPLGYLRYDTEEELVLINVLYRAELRLYKNFFQPVMKLIKKERVEGKVKRVYDTPKTPYQRLLESGQLSKEKEKELKELYQRLNPAELKRAIDVKLERLYQTYQRKKKRTITLNPYKKLVPSTVTVM